MVGNDIFAQKRSLQEKENSNLCINTYCATIHRKIELKNRLQNNFKFHLKTDRILFLNALFLLKILINPNKACMQLRDFARQHTLLLCIVQISFLSQNGKKTFTNEYS